MENYNIMPIQDIKIKKRIPNIVLGLALGLLALYLAPTCWSYLAYILSALAFTFTDQIVKAYIINAGTGHFSVKGHDVDMYVKDKDGNIISKDK
jgi:hypothetical protein